MGTYFPSRFPSIWENKSHLIFQLTYADTHPMFTARSFPHFFRIVPSENQFNEPRLALLREFNWTRLGTLYQNEAKYSLVSFSNYIFASKRLFLC